MPILQRIVQCGALALASMTAQAGAPVDSGALDPNFGAAGKVQIAPATVRDNASNLVATDVAVQSTGKTIVAGYDDQGGCYVFRLNLDGSLDTSFGNNGFGFAGDICGIDDGIVIRPDDRIVNLGHNGTGSAIFLFQFTADGIVDSSFATPGYPGYVVIQPASGDSIYGSRIVLDSDGTVAIAGTYHVGARNVNQFYFARISTDGKTVEPFNYEFGSGDNQDDHALDLGIDTQDRYVVGGYHRGASGNYDCTAIRISHDLYDVDPTFGSGGQTIVAFDLGGDNGDYCNALAVIKPSNYIVLGGHATASVGSGTYQAAVVALLDNNGNLAQYGCAAVCVADKFAFAFDNNPTSGLSNDITRLIVSGYDTRYQQIYAVGSGYQPVQGGGPYGNMFGIARLNLTAPFSLDTGLNGGGSVGVYFAERPTGIGLLTTSNTGMSAALNHGKLVVAGYTGTGSNAIAVTRLAAFDGIFKNGYDAPYYSP